jgi:7SK snRNA methylphosphate capping enzyme
LHGLNSALHHFFSRVFRCLLPGGVFVLEAQPFSTYAKSARLSPELKANYEKLRDGVEGQTGPDAERGWRSEDGDFERVLLEEIGFERKESRGETGEKGERVLVVFPFPCCQAAAVAN